MLQESPWTSSSPRLHETKESTATLPQCTERERKNRRDYGQSGSPWSTTLWKTQNVPAARHFAAAAVCSIAGERLPLGTGHNTVQARRWTRWCLAASQGVATALAKWRLTATTRTTTTTGDMFVVTDNSAQASSYTFRSAVRDRRKRETRTHVVYVCLSAYLSQSCRVHPNVHNSAVAGNLPLDPRQLLPLSGS